MSYLKSPHLSEMSRFGLGNCCSIRLFCDLRVYFLSVKQTQIVHSRLTPWDNHNPRVGVHFPSPLPKVSKTRGVMARVFFGFQGKLLPTRKGLSAFLLWWRLNVTRNP